jgi:hypothetical protein
MLYIITVIKRRRMRWMECVAVVGKKKNACGVLMGKPKVKTGILRDWVGGVWTGFTWLRLGTSGGPL